jgi:hypothetical protein
MVYSYFDSKPIFLGRETSVRKVILNSLISGISASAFMFAIIMIFWFTDPSQNLTFQNLIPSCIISIVIGTLVFLASLWRFFVIGKYREMLFEKIKKGDKK